MLNFLKRTRQLVNSRHEAICIVFGNESCDLDSAVSAISLAYLYQQNYQGVNNTKHYLPVLNVSRQDYPLKTEVQFLFNKYAIPVEDLTFRDELKLEFLERSDFILVDHHISPFAARCMEVFDHRPFDKSANLPTNCKTKIELVGSCATLIGAEMRDTTNETQKQEICSIVISILRSAIILDTVNFSVKAARATPKDEIICTFLEQMLISRSIITNKDREETFQMLVKARADISHLTPLQVLRKDLKILNDPEQTIRIALPVFPMLVQNFIRKSGTEEAVKQFATENGCDAILLLGMYVCQDDGSVHRDIGLITINKPNHCLAILESLLATENPSLCLQPYGSCDFLDGRFYKQCNIKVTRKHIMPIIKKTIEDFPLALSENAISH